MSPSPRGPLSRVAARVVDWRFTKPITRVALAAAGLLLLALIGHTALAGALAGPPSATTPAPSTATGTAPWTATAIPTSTSTPTPTAIPTTTSLASHAPASPDDPVVLNRAMVEDLRRLPGVGDKRANAILALRARLGRFRAVEDLLKVKGIGRAALKRLRPLVRLDATPQPDAGTPPSPTPSPH